MAYFAVEHIGEYPEFRADVRAGIVAATVANVHRGKRRPLKPTDFVPQFEGDRKGQSWQEVYAGMMALAKRQAPKGGVADGQDARESC